MENFTARTITTSADGVTGMLRQTSTAMVTSTYSAHPNMTTKSLGSRMTWDRVADGHRAVEQRRGRERGVRYGHRNALGERPGCR